MLQNIKNDYTRTNERTNLVTSSILELLIAAKNIIGLKILFCTKNVWIKKTYISSRSIFGVKYFELRISFVQPEYESIVITSQTKF